MANAFDKVSKAFTTRVDLPEHRSEGAKVVNDSNNFAIWKNDLWLLSSRSTASSEMGGEASCGEDTPILQRNSCTAGPNSNKSQAKPSTDGGIRTSVPARVNGGHISFGTTPETFSTIAVEHSATTLEPTTVQLTAETWRKPEKNQEKIDPASKLVNLPRSPQPSAHIISSRLKRARSWAERRWGRPRLAEGGAYGRREDATLHLEDAESTTASSSRRSSGLSQVKGSTKLLEELVGHVEEELAEQHVRFDCLQSFCEVGAESDYGFLPSGGTPETSASRDRNTEVEILCQRWCRARAKFLSCERKSRRQSTKLQGSLCKNGVFVVASSRDSGVQALSILDENPVSGRLHLLKKRTEKDLGIVCPTKKVYTNPTCRDARDTPTSGIAAAASQVKGFEAFFRTTEGHTCVSCERPMSCSRCYATTALSVIGVPFHRHDDTSQVPAATAQSSATVHACSPDGKERDRLAVGEGDYRGTGCFVKGDACDRCARNIYCLTCLEHMQEQTTGLREVVHESNLRATWGHEPDQHRERAEFSNLSVFTATPSRHVPTSSSSEWGEEKSQAPGRRPPAAHTSPTCICPQAGTRLDRRLVGIHEMAERNATRARKYRSNITGKQNDMPSSANCSSLALQGDGSAREAPLTDCEEADQGAFSRSGCVRPLDVGLAHAESGTTQSAPACGIAAYRFVEGKCKKLETENPVCPALQAVKDQALRVEGSLVLESWRRLRAAEISGSASFGRNISVMAFTDAEDVSYPMVNAACAAELRSCAQHRQYSRISYSKAGGGKYKCLKVTSKQEVLTHRELEYKDKTEFRGRALQPRSWELASPCRALQPQNMEQTIREVECSRAYSRRQGVRVLPASSFFKQNQAIYDSCFWEKFVPPSEKQKSTSKEPCSAATHLSLMHHQEDSGTVSAQRGEQGGDFAKAEAGGPRSAQYDRAMLPPDAHAINLFPSSPTEECSQQSHRVTRRRSLVSLSSAATHHLIEVRRRASSSPYVGAEGFSARPPWRRESWPLQALSRCVFSNSSSSSLRSSSPVLRARKSSTGAYEEPVSAGFDLEKQPFFHRNAWVRASCSVSAKTGRRSGVTVPRFDPYAASFPPQPHHRGKLAHTYSVTLSPPGPEEDNEEEESTYDGENESGAPTRLTAQRETLGKCDRSKNVDSGTFCQQDLDQAAQNASVFSPRQICGELTAGLFCDSAHWKQNHSVQQLESLRSPGCAGPIYPPLKRTVPLWEQGEHTQQREKDASVEKAVDAVAVAALSRNIDDLYSLCSTDVPPLLYKCLDTIRTPRAAVRHDNVVKGEQNLRAHEGEMGQRGRPAATSEIMHAGSVCSAPAGRSTNVALSGRTLETVVYCAYSRDNSPNFYNQGRPNLAQDEQYYKSDLSWASKAADFHHLEHPSRAVVVPTEKPFTCSWSARLGAASVSIESTISTTSQDISSEQPTFRTTLRYSRGGQPAVDISGGTPQAAIHAVWVTGSCTSTVQEESTRVSRHCQSAPPTVSRGKHEAELAPPPLPAPLFTVEQDGKSHGRQPSGTYAIAALDLASLSAEERCESKVSVEHEAIQRSSTQAVAIDHVEPLWRTVDVRACRPLPPHVQCLAGCYGGGEKTARKSAALLVRAVAGRGSERCEIRSPVRHGGSQQVASETKEQARFDEHLINSWISWREETALRPCQSAAVAPGWQSSFSKAPDSHPTFALHCGAQPAIIGSPHCSARSHYSDTVAIADDATQTDMKNPRCSGASQKRCAPDPREDEGKGLAADAWAECCTPENFRTTTASPHSPRKLRRRERKGTAHTDYQRVKEGHKLAESKKSAGTDIIGYRKEKREQAGKEDSEPFVMGKEREILSATSGAVQNLHSMRRAKKLAATGEYDADTGCQKTLESGTSSNSDNDSKGINVSLVAGGDTRPSFGNSVGVKRESSVNSAGFPAGTTPPTADAEAGGVVCPGTSVAELCSVHGKPRRRALPKKAMQTNAGKAGTTAVVRRTRNENRLSVVETRKSWRTGEDGKVFYDACGHKISGVWFDNGRRLWRVVFMQGERRRTKGFSLKQYSFEQARNLAVQCKLAIEARKALCKDNIAQTCSSSGRVFSSDDKF